MLKFGYERKEAKQIVLEMKGDTQTYALNLLNIFNHLREYPTIFYKLSNNSGNTVYVTFNPREEESVKEYLENFGTIEKIYTVRLYDITVDYKLEDFDKVHDLDITEYLIDEA
jgi:hypothetical protein